MSNTRKAHPHASGNPAVRNPAYPGPANGSPVPPMPGPSQDPVAVQVQYLANQLNALVQQNVENFKSLQQRGINFDQNQITNARIDSVIGAIAAALGPQGQLWELQCRLAFEQSMAANLEQAKAESTKAVLSQGGLLTPEGIRELARQTGTYGGH